MRTDLTALEQANQFPKLSARSNTAQASGLDWLQSASYASQSSFRSALADLSASRRSSAENGTSARASGDVQSFADATSSYALKRGSTERSDDAQSMEHEERETRNERAQDSTSDAQKLRTEGEASDQDEPTRNAQEVGSEHVIGDSQSRSKDGDVVSKAAEEDQGTSSRSEAAEFKGQQHLVHSDADKEKETANDRAARRNDSRKGVSERNARALSEVAARGRGAEEKADETGGETTRVDVAKRESGTQTAFQAAARADESDISQRREHIRKHTAAGNHEPSFEKAGAKRSQNVPPNANVIHGTEEARSSKHADSAQQARLQERAAEQQHLERSTNRTVWARRLDRIGAAAGRAVQVEAAIRLEHATGQTQSTDVSSRLANQTQQINLASLQTGGGQQQIGNSSLGQFSGADQPGQEGSSPRAALDDARFSGRVVRGLTAMVNQRGGTMTMRLDPPDMGQLRIQMTVARGVVTAEFQAQNSQAQQMLEKNMGTLRAALESQGLTVERLNVNTQNSAQQHGMMHDDGSARDQQTNRHDASSGQSRGRRDGEAASDHRDGENAEIEFDELVEQVVNQTSSE